jgi:hypothetical protein
MSKPAMRTLLMLVADLAASHWLERGDSVARC